MNALTNSAQAFDETCAKKARCENRWTAAEDKILFAQVLKGKSLVCRLVSEISLTPLKPMAARSVGDLWPPRYQEGTTSPAGRGIYPLLLSDFPLATTNRLLQMDPLLEPRSTQRYARSG